MLPFDFFVGSFLLHPQMHFVPRQSLVRIGDWRFYFLSVRAGGGIFRMQNGQTKNEKSGPKKLANRIHTDDTLGCSRG